jgi:hypothetical protein
MDWNASTWWWLAAGVLVAAELLSGTFYLLMLALGCVAGALAAHGGAGPTAQIAVAALFGAGATALALRRAARRGRHRSNATATSTSTSASRWWCAPGAPTAAPGAAPRRRLVGPAGARCTGHIGPARHRGRGRQPAATGPGLVPPPDLRSHRMEVVLVLAVIALIFVAAPSRSCRSRTPGSSSAWASSTAR